MRIHPSPTTFAMIDLEDQERTILVSLFSDTATLLGDEEPERIDPDDAWAELTRRLTPASGEVPEDPAVRRLLPDVDPEDAERSADFRRLTENDVRESKLANLRTCLFTLGSSGPLELDRNATRAWVKALTDTRLIIATRLGLEDEDSLSALEARGLSDHEEVLVTVYDLLSWAQERLTEILLTSLGRGDS